MSFVGTVVAIGIFQQVHKTAKSLKKKKGRIKIP